MHCVVCIYISRRFYNILIHSYFPPLNYQEIEYRTVTAAVNFVKSCADVDDLDTVAQSVFKNSCCSVEEGISKLRTSVDFYKSLSSNKNKPSPPTG